MNVSVWACPTDAEPRAAGTVLTVQLPGETARSLSTRALAAWPQTTLTHSQTVASSGSGTTDRAVVYTGVLLRDVLANSGFASATDRSARTSFVEAVATDGYRAVFSWGELFNSQVGEQAMIIAAQGGKPLDVAVGPPGCLPVQDNLPGGVALHALLETAHDQRTKVAHMSWTWAQVGQGAQGHWSHPALPIA